MSRLFAAFLAVLGLFAAGTAMAQNNYQVRPGDVLSVEVVEDPQLNRQVLVTPDGRFSFPFAGTVQASGRSVGQIERAIAAGIASNFVEPPTVFVSISRLRPDDPIIPELPQDPPPPPTIDVYFLGEIANPGLQQLEPGTTILQAFAQGGGFTTFAALKRVQLRRPNPNGGPEQVIVIDYRALSNGLALTQNIVLQDGDIILVPERRLFE